MIEESSERVKYASPSIKTILVSMTSLVLDGSGEDWREVDD